MKTIKQQNMDLDLRRFGKDVYTKAKESNGGSSDNLGKQIAEAFIDNLFKGYNESVPSNLVYPDFIATTPQQNLSTEETEITIIDSIPALVELIDGRNRPNICLYKQKPFETSPYAITGNESKIYMMSGEHLLPTIYYDNVDYKVDVNGVDINGETFYTVTLHNEPI